MTQPNIIIKLPSWVYTSGFWNSSLYISEEDGNSYFMLSNNTLLSAEQNVKVKSNRSNDKHKTTNNEII